MSHFQISDFSFTPIALDSSRLSYSSKESAVSPTVPSLPVLTHIQLSLCGELFSYDLRNLQSINPREVIELLKTTGSERGNWMIVGASYRRKRNPRAAIAILNEMLEVMAKHAIPEQELKPVYLLLSNCETDLARLARAQGPVSSDQSADHYQKARKWLQKVYGVQGSSISQAEPTYLPDSHYHQSLLLPRKPPSPVSDLPPRPSSPSHSGKYSGVEIQSLRERLRHQNDVLANVLTSKRKLEGRYQYERDTRRRLECTIDSLKRELSDARRMENSAQEQMKHEVKMRRMSEGKWMRERELRVELGRNSRVPERSPSVPRSIASYSQ
ncbi:hypothetical protein D9757_000693 [Collybiopsis confluens]|uniref:Uncharacterized protein n=1 Tax=Collybiopsis confluens TaxID=2823264 RepID=A0A8H5MGS1_9AGAR|nr:hypothetical protein D9757_000693 [Collybiopsis confluens]